MVNPVIADIELGVAAKSITAPALRVRKVSDEDVANGLALMAFASVVVRLTRIVSESTSEADPPVRV